MLITQYTIPSEFIFGLGEYKCAQVYHHRLDKNS